MYCKQCGKELDPNAKFCTNCGTPVEQKENQPEQNIHVHISNVPQEKKSGAGKVAAVLAILAIIIAGAAFWWSSNGKDEPQQASVQQYGSDPEEKERFYDGVVIVPEDVDYVFPDSDVRYLSVEDLKKLNAEQCRIARNEIYARHGRMFKDKKLQEYFDSCSWYYPTIEPEDFQESLLSEVEIKNRDLIVQYEKEKGYQ